MRFRLPFFRRTATAPTPVDPTLLFESEAAFEAAVDPAKVRAAVRALTGRGVIGDAADTAFVAITPVVANTPAATLDPRVTVDAVIARKTHVQWLEAVAIVHAVSTQALDTGIPDVSAMVLTAKGRVQLEPPMRSLPVDQLARTLHVLVSGEQIPAPLRLFISKWIAPADAHTLSDFTKELAYFARPDGETLIRAVYERYLNSASVPAPIAPPAPPPPQKEQRSKKIAVPRWAIVTAAALVIAAVATVIVRTTNLASMGVPSLAFLSASADDGQRADKTDTELPVEKSRRRPVAPAHDAPGAPPRTDSSGPQRSFAPRLPLGAATIDVFGQPTPAPLPSRRAPAGTSATAAGDGTPFSPRPALRERVRDRVYNVGDADVEPPLMLYPTLPPVLAVNGDTNTMEVVVSREGTVERVRLISIAKRMTDMMLLSGAKTWRFQPASLAGEAVRYRMVVSWSATP